jgi:hypothetical protein
MASETTSVRPAAGARGGAAGPPALPDVNAQIYPFDVVQRLLDQTANFSLFAVPERHHAESATLTPNDPGDWFGLNGGYGVAVGCVLHRFESVVGAPAGGRVPVAQAIGEGVATFRSRWLFGPADLEWATGREPPPALFDPWRSQRFAALDTRFIFAGGKDGCEGYGVGRTFFVSAGGRPQTLAGAVGNLTGGFGKFHGLEGTFVLTGTLTAELGFRGVVTLRVVDPHGKLRTGREIPPLRAAHGAHPGATFIVVRGVKQDSSVHTTYGPPPDERRVSLVTPSQMRSARYSASGRGPGGLNAEMRVGAPVGRFSATVYFDLLAPPGTADRPVPFTTEELYEFLDADGRVVGTVTAGVVEGQSFGLRFPAAPEQPGVRFAGFGPVTGGTGPFAGARGMLTVNSLIGISPHALSLLHTLHLLEPGPGPPAAAPAAPKEDHLAENDPFRPMLRHAEEYTDRYLAWRQGMRRCADALSAIFVQTYNRVANVGDFPDLPIDPAQLSGILRAEIKPFDEETFNRYGGPAKGTFRIYDFATGKEVGSSVLYSYWDPKNLFVHGRYMKKISGADAGYFNPRQLPDLAEKKVDIILNSYRPDVGVTSWVEVYQHQRQQRTSFAYKLPHQHEILWFVRDVSLGGKPVHNDVFMASHEWKGFWQGKVAYFMVGIFFEVDFNACTARVSGDTFWRALYLEE